MNGKRYCACWEGFFFHTNGVGACKIYHLPGEGGESVKVSKTLGLRKSSEKKKVKQENVKVKGFPFVNGYIEALEIPSIESVRKSIALCGASVFLEKLLLPFSTRKISYSNLCGINPHC